MNAKSVKGKCTGCELCMQTCPEMFMMDNDGFAREKMNEVPYAAELFCRLAAAECPVEAIIITE